jgi:hypothetical protein
LAVIDDGPESTLFRPSLKGEVVPGVILEVFTKAFFLLIPIFADLGKVCSSAVST